jgi:hypothetical protein
VPRPILETLTWQQGDVLAMAPRDGGLVVRRVDEASLLEAPAPPRKVRARGKKRG